MFGAFLEGGAIQVGDAIDMKYLYIYIFTTYAKASRPTIEDPAIIHKQTEEMVTWLNAEVIS